MPSVGTCHFICGRVRRGAGERENVGSCSNGTELGNAPSLSAILLQPSAAAVTFIIRVKLYEALCTAAVVVPVPTGLLDGTDYWMIHAFSRELSTFMVRTGSSGRSIG